MDNKEKEFERFLIDNSFVGGTIICKDCNTEFYVSSHELSHFYSYDQSIPKRCKNCRSKRKVLNNK